MLLVATVVWFASPGASALADDPPALVPSRAPVLTPPELSELRSISEESRAATVLYVAGGGLLFVGGIFGGVAALNGMRSIGPSWGSGSSGSRRDWEGVAWAALAAGGVGLVLVLVGVGLDVDSGSRRGALRARQDFGFSLGPLDGGAFGALTLAF